MLDESSLPLDREGRERWLAQQEAAIGRLARTELRRVVQAAVDRYTGSLTAAGDPAAFDAIPHAWLTVVEENLAPKLGEVYQAGQVTAWLGMRTQPTTAFARQWTAVANQAAVSYMGQATNRLAGVGQGLWKDVRSQAQTAVAKGLTNEQLKGEIEKLTGFTEYRADTIARTETVGAYVQGDMAGARALGDRGPVEKVWVAAIDPRTRETHAAAHNTCIPMADQFDIGGVRMDSPHDPSGPPAEVVNCRCYVEMLYPGDTRPDGTTVEAVDGTEAPQTEAIATPPPPPDGRIRSLQQSSARGLTVPENQVWTVDHLTGHAGSLSDMDRVVAYSHNGVTIIQSADQATWSYLQTPGIGFDDAVGRIRMTSVEAQLDQLTDVVGPNIEHLDRVIFTPDPNPQDAYWAHRYNRPDFDSAATGGEGTITVYRGQPMKDTTLHHEFGHILDDEAAGLRLGASPEWQAAIRSDAANTADFGRYEFDAMSARARDGHMVTLGDDRGITSYGWSSPQEDVAESVRLYLADRIDGHLSIKGKRFADLFPGRARLIDQLLVDAAQLV